jgi:hypothetical protein
MHKGDSDDDDDYNNNNNNNNNNRVFVPIRSVGCLQVLSTSISCQRTYFIPTSPRFFVNRLSPTIFYFSLFLLP